MTTETHPITQVEQRGSIWQVRKQMPTMLFDVIFRQEAITMRAAEYGIDPTDSRTIVDILLHEIGVDQDQTHPRWLFNTTNTPVALAYLNSQIKAVKSFWVVTDPDNLLDKIHTAHVPDMDLHAKHLAAVTRLRLKRAGKLSYTGPKEFPSPKLWSPDAGPSQLQ